MRSYEKWNAKRLITDYRSISILNFSCTTPAICLHPLMHKLVLKPLILFLESLLILKTQIISNIWASGGQLKCISYFRRGGFRHGSYSVKDHPRYQCSKFRDISSNIPAMGKKIPKPCVTRQIVPVIFYCCRNLSVITHINAILNSTMILRTFSMLFFCN